MRRFSLVSLLAAASSVSAGVVSVPFTRRHAPDGSPPPPLVRRDGSLNLDAINNITGGGYYAEFGVGTPPQTLNFLLDTGSSDTWVNSVGTDFCTSLIRQIDHGYCQKQFSPNESSSFELMQRDSFNITYLDRRHIEGDYFNDTVAINGASLKNQQLGLALETVRTTGIMGLGLGANLVARDKYPTIIDNMVAQGHIAAPAFSLYLDDLGAARGTVLFGGVDTDKFDDGIATLPLQPQPASGSRDITTYTVKLEGFGVTGVDTGLSAGAILDSGSTISLLPDDALRNVWKAFGVKSVRNYPTPFVDCAHATRSKDVTFSFLFRGKTIKVPMAEMVINSFDGKQDAIMHDPALRGLFNGWRAVCLFGIGSTATYGLTTNDFVLLGDTFLRSAYVVYDLANKQVGIAQARINSSSSTIVEFKAGSKTIPGPSAKGAGVDLAPPFIVIAGTLIMTVATIMSAL